MKNNSLKETQYQVREEEEMESQSTHPRPTSTIGENM